MPQHDPDPLPDIDGLLPDGQRDSGWKRELAGPLVPAVSAAMTEGAQVAIKMPKSVRNLLKYISERDDMFALDVLWTGVRALLEADPDLETRERLREAEADYRRWVGRRKSLRSLHHARSARRPEVASMAHLNSKGKTAR